MLFTLNLFDTFYTEMERWKEAEDMYLMCYDQRKLSPGADHASTVISLSYLNNIEYSYAEPLYNDIHHPSVQSTLICLL